MNIIFVKILIIVIFIAPIVHLKLDKEQLTFENYMDHLALHLGIAVIGIFVVSLTYFMLFAW